MKIKLYPRNAELRRIELERARNPQLQFIKTGGEDLRTARAATNNKTGSSAGVFQPLDAELTAIAGLTSAADKLPYFTGSGTAAVTTLTSFGRSLIDDANAAAGRSTLSAAASGANADITSMTGLTGGVAGPTYVQLATGLSPTTPGAGFLSLYASSGDKHPYAINEDGDTFDLAAPNYSAIMQPATPKVNNTSTTLGSTDVGVVQYCGRAPRRLASGGTIKLTFIVTQAWVSAGTTPWCEVAVLKGSVVSGGGNPSLSLIGYVAVASAAGTGTKTYSITTTAEIEAGDDIWIGWGSKATTTRHVFRSVGSDEWGYGIIATKTTMATFSGASYPVTFTADATANTGAACIVQY